MVKQTTLTLGSCAAGQVVLRASIPRTTFTPTQPVEVVGLLQNVGGTDCTYAGDAGAGDGHPTIGPCGVFPMTVRNRHGTNIWPGPAVYSCPMMGQTRFAAGTQVRATGTWPKSVVTRRGSRAAPPGTYRLIVAGKVTFTIRLR